MPRREDVAPISGGHVIRRFLPRASGALVALALGAAGLVTVGAAAPASAASVTCSTKVTLDVYESTITYGGYESLSADVTPVNCSDTYVSSGAGRVLIERSLDNGRSWQGIKAGDYPAYVSLGGSGVIKVAGLYRAHYTGGKESTSYDPSTFH